MGGGEVSLNPAELLFKDARLMGMTGANKADLIEALAMLESGAVTPVVTPFPLADAARVLRWRDSRTKSLVWAH